jgi:NAD(P)-dependent dehydrogenase (short-subunit alcohol dehydrogenase family)
MSIIVTGSTGGIGSCIQSKLVSANIDVIALTRDLCDLNDATSVCSMSNIDGLIYCAGINIPAEYKSVSLENMTNTMQTNCLSFVSLCQSINFNEGANIIAIGSLYATETRAGRLAYTMSKHAMLGAIKTLAIEMSKCKIKINMISPGFVLTPLTEKNNSVDRIQQLQNSIPLGMTTPNDIAEICEFLVTKNHSITGQNIIIDGGYSLLGI